MARPVIMKTFGGKYYSKDWIISHFPANYQYMDYCEPFLGGGNIFFQKQSSVNEIISDLDEGTIAVFKVVKEIPEKFVDALSKLFYVQSTFDWALEEEKREGKSLLDLAVNEYVLRNMSRGGMRKTFGWSERQRGGMPGDANAWKNRLSYMIQYSDRLRKTQIECEDALTLIPRYSENKNITIYIDCPYLHSTRVSKKVYKNELGEEHHIELANILNEVKGKVIISGYDSPLYQLLYKGWRIEKMAIVNHSGQNKEKNIRMECIWLNY